MNTQPTKKPFPDAVKKQDFYDKYYSMIADGILRKRINQIIYAFRKDLPENQGKTFKNIVRTQTIEKKELLEYARTYYFPAEFFDDEMVD